MTTKNRTDYDHYGLLKKLAMLFLLVMPIMALAQNNPATDNEKWVLSKTLNSVSIYYRLADCQGQQVVYMKFENKNPSSAIISWKDAISIRELNNTKTILSETKNLVLLGGATLQSGCNTIGKSELRAVTPQSSPVTPTVLEFNFKDLTVTN